MQNLYLPWQPEHHRSTAINYLLYLNFTQIQAQALPHTNSMFNTILAMEQI